VTGHALQHRIVEIKRLPEQERDAALEALFTEHEATA
jgi:hypothetical protein